jgi:hypothetical protein
MNFLYFSVMLEPKNTCGSSEHFDKKNLLLLEGDYLHIFCVDVYNKWNFVLTYRPIVRQRLGKHIPAKAKARNNKTSIARQRISKHASLKMEAVSSPWFAQRGYTEVFSRRSRE